MAGCLRLRGAPQQEKQWRRGKTDEQKTSTPDLKERRAEWQ